METFELNVVLKVENCEVNCCTDLKGKFNLIYCNTWWDVGNLFFKNQLVMFSRIVDRFGLIRYSFIILLLYQKSNKTNTLTTSNATEFTTINNKIEFYFTVRRLLWRVPTTGAAHFASEASARSLPSNIRTISRSSKHESALF